MRCGAAVGKPCRGMGDWSWHTTRRRDADLDAGFVMPRSGPVKCSGDPASPFRMDPDRLEEVAPDFAGPCLIELTHRHRGGRGRWWGPKSCGYTDVFVYAGVYSADEARSICDGTEDYYPVDAAAALRAAEAEIAEVRARVEALLPKDARTTPGSAHFYAWRDVGAIERQKGNPRPGREGPDGDAMREGWDDEDRRLARSAPLTMEEGEALMRLGWHAREAVAMEPAVARVWLAVGEGPVGTEPPSVIRAREMGAAARRAGAPRDPTITATREEWCAGWDAEDARLALAEDRDDEPETCGRSYDEGYARAMRGEVYECGRAPGHDGPCGPAERATDEDDGAPDTAGETGGVA